MSIDNSNQSELGKWIDDAVVKESSSLVTPPEAPIESLEKPDAAVKESSSLVTPPEAPIVIKEKKPNRFKQGIERIIKPTKELLRTYRVLIIAGAAVACFLLVSTLTGYNLPHAWETIVNKIITGKNETVTFDVGGREARYEFFNPKDEQKDTYYKSWRSGEPTGFNNAYDLYLNLSPKYQTGMDQMLGIAEFCGPQCFFQTDLVPLSDQTLIAGMLGLSRDEYLYYSQFAETQAEWDRVREGLVKEIQQKSPYKDDVGFCLLFGIRPTTNISPWRWERDKRQPSDFENWYNQWHEVEQQIGVFNPNIRTTTERIQAVGLHQFKNVFAGRRNFPSNGGGFGTSKGFS